MTCVVILLILMWHINEIYQVFWRNSTAESGIFGILLVFKRIEVLYEYFDKSDIFGTFW